MNEILGENESNDEEDYFDAFKNKKTKDDLKKVNDKMKAIDEFNLKQKEIKDSDIINKTYLGNKRLKNNINSNSNSNKTWLNSNLNFENLTKYIKTNTTEKINVFADDSKNKDSKYYNKTDESSKLSNIKLIKSVYEYNNESDKESF